MAEQRINVVKAIAPIHLVNCFFFVIFVNFSENFVK